MSKATPKSAKRHADKLFSQLVRSLGWCECCGKAGGEVQLQCAHWLSRRYSNIRVDPSNAFCLCAGCHIYFTHNPTAFSDWALKQRGRGTYKRLREAAESGAKVDWISQVEVLKQMLKETVRE